jgi:cytochrome P450
MYSEAYYIIFIFVICHVLVSYFRGYLRELRFRKFAKEHGAVDPPHIPCKLPWSIDATIKMAKAAYDGKDVLEEVFMRRMLIEMKAWTYWATGTFGAMNISTAEPKNFQAVLALDFESYQIGAMRKAKLRMLLGDHSIFLSDGEQWSQSRALIRPIFARSNINDMEDMERAVQALLHVIKTRGECRSDDGRRWTSVVNLKPLFYRFSLDTATAFLFGQSVESQMAAAADDDQEVGFEESEGFAQAFSVVQTVFAWRITLGGLYFLADGPKLRRAVKTMLGFASRTVERTLKTRAKVEDKPSRKYNVIEELAKATQDPNQIRDQTISMLQLWSN